MCLKQSLRSSYRLQTHVPSITHFIPSLVVARLVVDRSCFRTQPEEVASPYPVVHQNILGSDHRNSPTHHPVGRMLEESCMPGCFHSRRLLAEAVALRRSDYRWLVRGQTASVPPILCRSMAVGRSAFYGVRSES
jgi:hypothetical protein